MNLRLLLIAAGFVINCTSVIAQIILPNKDIYKFDEHPENIISEG